MNCPNCGQNHVDCAWIDSQEITHCVCQNCLFEWIE